MPGSLRLQKAAMIPLDDSGNPDFDAAIAVQFNPETLKVTQSNTLETSNSGGTQEAAAQFIDKSESSLTLQLVFDTSVARAASEVELQAGSGDTGEAAEGETRTITAPSHEALSDVRLLTRRVADAFMQPRAEGDRMKAPQKCRFQWGTFAFVGMMSSYDETLDFFAPEGVPLRATLALTLKEDRYQFETLPGGGQSPDTPDFAPGGDDVPIAEAAQAAGEDPRSWRSNALFNGIETPRISGSAGLSLPGVDISVSASAGISGAIGASAGGFSAGFSGSLGTGLPGAFNASAGLPGLSAGASGGLPGLTASASGGLPGLSASASGGLPGLSAGASGGLPGVSASASGRLPSVSASATAGLGGVSGSAALPGLSASATAGIGGAAGASTGRLPTAGAMAASGISATGGASAEASLGSGGLSASA
ncbi:MAG: hypothetical protein AAGA32_10810, partial [Pseudomonadota bacterium]